MRVNPIQLTLGVFNLRAFNHQTIKAAFTLISSLLLFCITAEAALGKNCDSAFTTFSFTPPVSASTQLPSIGQPLLDVQARQFVQLLIDSQSKNLIPSERQSRLADAQRVFTELTEAHPEIAELIQEEWRKLHSGSESATEQKRQKLISEILTREQQLLTLTLQFQQMGEWEIVKDSATDPKVKAELETHLLKESLKSKFHSKVPSVHLQNSDSSFSSFISVSQNGGLIKFNARGPNGHSDYVRGATVHPDGRIISWSDDRTLILWKLVSNNYVVDQRLGEAGTGDPSKGHIGLISGAQVLSDGSILSSSADYTLILWKWVNGTYVFHQRLGEAVNLNQRADPNKGHLKSVSGAQVLPDGRILSWSCEESKLILWKLVDETYVIDQKLGELYNPDPKKGHTEWVAWVQVLPDGRILSWSDDHTLIIWSPINKRYVLTARLGQISNSDPQKGHTKRVIDAKVLHDGRILSSDHSDRFLIWQSTHPKAIQTEIESLSKELDSLKTALTGLEARRSSIEDVSETGAP